MSKGTETICPICGTNELRVRFSEVTDPQTGEIFRILECASCDVGVTDPRPAEIEPYYSEYYGERHGFTKTFRSGRRAALVRRSIPDRSSGLRLLDIGCGDGSFLETIRAQGVEAIGTELNAREAETKNIYGDLAEVCGAFGAGSIDVITMWHSLEHFHDPLKVLREAHELLRRDGRILVAVPNSASLQATATGRHWLHLDVPGHLFHFDRRSLAGVMRDAGFDIQSTQHLEIEYDILGWSQSFLNRIFRVPNVFFRQLSGHPTRVDTFTRGANFLLGSVLAAASLPFVAAGSLAGRGASLIVVARPQETE